MSFPNDGFRRFVEAQAAKARMAQAAVAGPLAEADLGGNLYDITTDAVTILGKLEARSKKADEEREQATAEARRLAVEKEKLAAELGAARERAGKAEAAAELARQEVERTAVALRKETAALEGERAALAKRHEGELAPLRSRLESLEEQLNEKQDLLLTRDSEVDALMAKIGELTQSLAEIGTDRVVDELDLVNLGFERAQPAETGRSHTTRPLCSRSTSTAT